jgi:integron integrase
MPLENIKAERARREPKLPVWLTKDECKGLFAAMQGEPKLLAMLAYGTGLRLMELLRLRVKDLDFGNGVLSVYQGKGKRNRLVPLPRSLVPQLRAQIATVKALHEADLADGFGAVWLPDNLALKWPKAPKDLGWQYLWPAKSRSQCPKRGEARHHLFATGFQQSLARAGRAAGIEKNVHPHCLRHSHATHLLEMGRSISEVQARLGHKDVRTTMIYTHCVEMGNAPSPVDCLCSH